MKLLFAVNGHEYTARHRLPLLEAAAERGYRVEAAAPRRSPALARLREAGFDCHSISVSRRGTNPLREAWALLDLIRLYARVRPTLVHHATIKPVIYGGMAARICGVPAVVQAITGLGYIFASDAWGARILRRVVIPLYKVACAHPRCRIVFQNTHDFELLCSYGVCDPDRGRVIQGSGVDTDLFTPASSKPERVVVGFIARMLYDKGAEEFVEAARVLRRRYPDVTFWMIGDEDPGNPSAVPRARLQAWAEEGAVEWLGQRQDMPDLYREISIVCLPSSYGEGLPKVLLEAASSGLPVVTTDIPGCRDAVRDRATGFVVPVNDADALVDRISLLIDDPDLRTEMGSAARQRCKQRFAVTQVVDESMKVYRELLEEDISTVD